MIAEKSYRLEFGPSEYAPETVFDLQLYLLRNSQNVPNVKDIYPIKFDAQGKPVHLNVIAQTRHCRFNGATVEAIFYTKGNIDISIDGLEKPARQTYNKLRNILLGFERIQID